MQTNYKITYLLAVVFTAGITLTSCKKDFLDITPKGKVIATTVSDYNLLLNNLSLINVSTDGQVPMGDEMAAIDPLFSGALLRTQRLFGWNDVIYDPGQDATEMSVPMSNIYLYNKIINEAPGATEGTDAQKNSIIAEARAGRAWTNFLLINYYGKPYKASTAATDPGFPIITAADVTASNFSRASVQSMYDFIIADLTAAIPNLPVQMVGRVRMTKCAAEAILGKVYLFMGRYTDALPMLNAAIADFAVTGNTSLPVALYDYNVTFGTGGSFLPIGIFGPAYPTLPTNTENLYAKQFIDNWSFTSSELVITPATVALYKSSDLRLKFYSKMPYPSGAVYPSGTLRRIGPIAAQYGMVLPDIYLMRAECRARTNDLTGAKADVELLRSKRMPASDVPVPAATAADKDLLTIFIFEERIREFACQGYRWFDMRRLSVDPVLNNTVNYTHTVYTTGGAVSATFTLKPERLTMRFPQKVMDQNPGMTNNP